MKALSMKQPVPELILQGLKTIETRTWKTDFVGEFYLHASQQIMEDFANKFNLDRDKLPLGAIVGKAKIIGRKIYNSAAEFGEDRKKHLVPGPPKKIPTYGYLLTDVERFEHPVKIPGRLSFFEVNL